MKFYTNVFTIKNNLYHYFIEDNRRRIEKVQFKPFLAISTDKESEYKDIYGDSLGRIDFDSMIEMFLWKKENRNSVDLYNDVQPPYQFISQTYPGVIDFDFTKLKVFNIDIEVDSLEGFPYPDKAKFPIVSITIQNFYKNQFYVFGLQPYKAKKDNIVYYHMEDEESLLSGFIDFFRKERPDILTGWYTEGFDIPYLINRAKNILKKGKYLELSPVRLIRGYSVSETVSSYHIVGVQHLDYQNLYKKYQMNPRENYTLDHVCEVELGEKKLEYKNEYDNLGGLYRKNHELFIDYNIKDVELVGFLNNKLKYIELLLRIAFLTKSNFEDCLGSVKVWENYMYNTLLEDNILVPPNKHSLKIDFPGGYVKSPNAGMHKWIVVWDITSSYPHQIISYNLSPETIINYDDLPEELQELRKKHPVEPLVEDNSKEQPNSFFENVDNLKEIAPILKKYNVTMATNGEFFSKEKFGIVPKLIANVFGTRVQKKGEAKVLYNEINKLKKKESSEEEIEKKQNEFAEADGIQYALKILMNSFYGVFSNEYFRFFDIRIASAVTCNGQIAIKGPAEYLTRKIPLVSIEYTDTDSLFISTEKVLNKRFKDEVSLEEKRDFVKKFNNKALMPLVVEYYQKLTDRLNCYKNTFEMDFEVISDKTIFIAKKKYVMNLVYKDGYDLEKSSLKKKGLEIVRTSTPKVVRGKLEELVKLILKTENNEDCLNFIDEFKKEFIKLPFIEIAFPRGVKGLKKYKNAKKSVPIHVRASLTYNKALKKLKLKKYQEIQEGEKIKFSYIKVPNHFGENVIACLNKMPDEIFNNIEIDYDLQFFKTFLKPVQIIFDVLEWQSKRIAKLDSFF